MVQQSLLWCRLAALLAPLLGANYLPKKHEKDTFNHICTIFYTFNTSDHIKWKSKVFSREGGMYFVLSRPQLPLAYSSFTYSANIRHSSL